ncbi:hypothetical protein [Variovorax sp. HW608]|uniref:hypothetical protein n=1 Tax=Variovorax sp. HW608 TaxID=1034889 RepID=UPI0012FD2CF6|nr:hypothetical protein [Variovorax sp. HW608]
MLRCLLIQIRTKCRPRQHHEIDVVLARLFVHVERPLADDPWWSATGRRWRAGWLV